MAVIGFFSIGREMGSPHSFNLPRDMTEDRPAARGESSAVQQTLSKKSLAMSLRGAWPVRRVMRPAARALRQYQYRHLIGAAYEPRVRALASVEVADRRNYQLGSDETGRYLELRLFPGQRMIHNGVRSELSLHYRYDDGDTVEYSWMMRLPPDFNGHEAHGHWWILAQWHDQPDPNIGEDWSSFPGREAPIQLLYQEKEGRHQISLMYGAPAPLLIGSVDISENQWIPIKALIHWSRSIGKIELTIGSQAGPQIVAIGPNMLNGYFHFLKVGTYRDPAIQTYSNIHIRGVTAKTHDR